MVENNSKYTDALPKSRVPNRAIGALGLGKLSSANVTSHKWSVSDSNWVCICLGYYDVPEGSEYSDKATDTD